MRLAQICWIRFWIRQICAKLRSVQIWGIDFGRLAVRPTQMTTSRFVRPLYVCVKHRSLCFTQRMYILGSPQYISNPVALRNYFLWVASFANACRPHVEEFYYNVLHAVLSLRGLLSFNQDTGRYIFLVEFCYGIRTTDGASSSMNH